MRIFYSELYLFLCYLIFANTTKYTNIENIPNVCTYTMQECIKDNLPCNAYKKCYAYVEKHLARKLPDIDSKTTFEIGEITFKMI